MRIPVAVPLQSRDGTTSKDAKTKNAIVEAKGEKLYLRKRPGLNDRGLIKAGTAQLLTYWNSDFVTVQGDYLNIGITNDSVHVTTWNSADKASTVTLSNGDLTATITTVGSAGCVRSAIAVTSGTWYWEFTVSDSSDLSVGLANSSASLTATPGFSDNGLAYFRSGAIQKGNSTVATGSAFVNGAVIGVFYDADTRVVKFYEDGTLQATLSGANVPTGDLYAIVGASSASSGAGTANFGATAFTHSVPGVSSQSFSPTTAGLMFSAQESGSNAPENLLMVKNSEQAWVLDESGALTQITDVDYPGKYTVTLTSLTRSGTTATATTAADTNFQVGSSVTIAGANQSDYNGAKTITAVTPSSVAGTGATVKIGITRSGTTATATAKDAPHGFVNGQSVKISGAEQAEYNGEKTITWLSGTQFSFSVTATTGNIVTPATGTITYFTEERRGSGSLSGGTITVNYPNHGYVTGQEIDARALGNLESLGRNATITVTDADTFTFTALGSVSVYTSGGIGFSGRAISVSSVTASGSTGTVTTNSAHNVVTGDLVSVFGATQAFYNVLKFPVTVTGSTTFTYQLGPGAIADSPATPATGNITAEGVPSITPASFTFTVANSPVTPATGTITAEGGRSTVPGIIYLDGRFGVMDVDGVIYVSEEDQPDVWFGLSYFTALAESGVGKAIAKNLNYGVAFKEWSTEFFYNAANQPPGSPWSPVENLHKLVGCAQGWSVADVSGSLLWIAQEKRQAGRSVYMMVGAEIAKVSTPDIDRILNADDMEEVHAYGVTLDGQRLYILTLEDTGITLVYNLDAKLWGEWSSYTIGDAVSVSSITRSGTTATVTFSAAHGLSDGDPVLIAGANQAAYNGIHQAFYVSSTVITIEVDGSPTTPATGTITGKPYAESYFKFPKYATGEGIDAVLHESDGHLYEFLPSVYLDDDAPINVFTRSERLDGDTTARKKMPAIRVIGDSVGSFCVIRWSDDDSATFSAYRKVTLSDEEPEIRRCGSFKRRSLELRHIANTSLQLEGLELEIT